MTRQVYFGPIPYLASPVLRNRQRYFETLFFPRCRTRFSDSRIAPWGNLRFAHQIYYRGQGSLHPFRGIHGWVISEEMHLYPPLSAFIHKRARGVHECASWSGLFLLYARVSRLYSRPCWRPHQHSRLRSRLCWRLHSRLRSRLPSCLASRLCSRLRLRSRLRSCLPSCLISRLCPRLHSCLHSRPRSRLPLTSFSDVYSHVCVHAWCLNRCCVALSEHGQSALYVHGPQSFHRIAPCTPTLRSRLRARPHSRLRSRPRYAHVYAHVHATLTSTLRSRLRSRPRYAHVYAHIHIHVNAHVCAHIYSYVTSTHTSTFTSTLTSTLRSRPRYAHVHATLTSTCTSTLNHVYVTKNVQAVRPSPPESGDALFKCTVAKWICLTTVRPENPFNFHEFIDKAW